MPMNDYTNHFSYSMPATIEFGVGKIKSLGGYVQKLKGSKVLLVTDAGIVKV